MKKVFKFFAAALAIVAAASCAKELSDNNTTQTPDQELVHKVFSASLNVDSDTKTTLHYGEDGIFVHWSEGDKIKVIPSGSATGNDFNIVSIDGTFADFEGETVDADSHRAVYPASSFYTGNYGGYWGFKSESTSYLFGNSQGNALAEQTAIVNDFSWLNDFSASSNFAISTNSENQHLKFRNINAYLKLNLAMSNAASIEISASRVSGQINTSTGSQDMVDGKLGGPIQYDITHKKIGIIAGYGEDITFRNDDGNNLLPDVNYYIAIPSVKIEGLKLVVKDANGKVLQTMTKKSTFTAEPNMIYNLGTIEEAKVEPAKVGDYFYSDGTYSTALDNSKTVVGVVIFAGNPKNQFNDSALPDQYCNGLAISLAPKSVYFHNAVLSVNDPDLVLASKPTTQYNIGGYTIKEKWNSVANLSLYTTDYGALPSNTSGWYHGTPKEWGCIFENLTIINEKLETAGKEKITLSSTNTYLLPILKNTSQLVWTVGYSYGFYAKDAYWKYNSTYYPNNARPIFAF